MKKIFKFFLITIITVIFLYSCGSVKDGLTSNKRGNSDEFLVEKKNPLVIPPKFNELPKPETSEPINTTKELTEISIEDKIKKEITQNKNSQNDQIVNGSIEESILEKIKTN
tara:strand:+ start:266 stop:601 length:336 start_codon:yes stop_codon:yes gene_type:complete